MTPSPAAKKKTIIFICFLGAIAGLLFGLDTGVIAGALPFLSEEFDISPQMGERIVGALMLGAMVGAIFSGWLSYYIGRKYSLMVAAILFVFGSIICALTPNAEVLMIARVLLGLAIGIASYAAPLYLSEIAPERIRGSMISMYQLLITVGILGAYLSDTAFSYSGSWRWMLGIVAVPAALMLFGILLLPRSPRWLASKGRMQEAETVLDALRETPQEAQAEMDEIVDSLKIQQSGWNLFKNNVNFRRSVGLGIVLQIMQQFTGINIILYYAPKIFEVAGFTSTTQQMWGTVIVGLTNVLATFIAMGVVDSWGRRKTLVLGFTVMAIGMGVLSLMLALDSQTVLARYFSIFMLLVFIVGFAMSAGPLIWVLCSEIQPLKGRDFGITVSTATNWGANMVLSMTFLTLLASLGGAKTFMLYAVLNFAFVFVTLWLVPETKNISLEHIEANLMVGKKLREIGQPLRFRS